MELAEKVAALEAQIAKANAKLGGVSDGGWKQAHALLWANHKALTKERDGLLERFAEASDHARKCETGWSDANGKIMDLESKLSAATARAERAEARVKALEQDYKSVSYGFSAQMDRADAAERALAGTVTREVALEAIRRALGPHGSAGFSTRAENLLDQAVERAKGKK